MRICLLSLFFAVMSLPGISFATPSNSYRFVILYDSGAKTEAENFVKYLKNQQPFAGLGTQLDIQLGEVSKERMGCEGNCSGIERLVCCSGVSNSMAFELFPDRLPNRTLAFTSVASGGSGGNVPVAGVGYSANTMLHEMLHSFGFSDEYAYGANEVEFYCDENGLRWAKSPNLAFIKPKSSYSSDAEARNQHQNQIPWYDEIKNSTLITTIPGLGTTAGIFPAEEPALYEGGACLLKVMTYKPFYIDTVMSSLSQSNLPKYYQKILVQAMSAEVGEQLSWIESPPPQTGENPRSSNKKETKARTESSLPVSLETPIANEAK